MSGPGHHSFGPHVYFSVAGFLLAETAVLITAHSMSDSAPTAPESTTELAQPEPGKSKRPNVFPVLEKLAELYPRLFGSAFLPLKRGIFQDLLAAHPDVFERDLLKAALSMHTRSTRYLSAVASGQQRHDLTAQAVEAMAPEHIHHALVEVFRRRQNRSKEDLRPQLIERMVRAIQESSLGCEAYAELNRGRDEEANALLDEALTQARVLFAKNEALLRTFEASGKTTEEFADMYGLKPKDVARNLERARRSRA
jgi:sRNA-binding protein